MTAKAGLCADPPGAKPLDLIPLKMNGFPKALGLWWVLRGAASRRDGKALALPFPHGLRSPDQVAYPGCLIARPSSAARQRYQLATLRQGDHISPMAARSFGFG